MGHTKAVAFSGIIVAVSFVSMMLTGMFPFASFAFPAFAGLLAMIVKVEYGYKFALLTYLSTGLLSLLFCPDKMAAITYIFILGFYPILKIWLEHKVIGPVKRISLKTLIFLATFALCFLVLSVFFPAEIYLEGAVTPLLLCGFFVLTMITFYIYDIAIQQVLAYYIVKIKRRR